MMVTLTTHGLGLGEFLFASFNEVTDLLGQMIIQVGVRCAAI